MDVTHLIEILNATAETLPSLQESERLQLLQACDALKTKLETPFDLASRLVFSVCRMDQYLGTYQDLTGQIGSPSNSPQIRCRSEIVRRDSCQSGSVQWVSQY